MKLLSTIFFLLLFFNSYAQEEKNEKTVDVLIGAKTRITPIYLKQVPDVIHLGSVDDLEQPNRHLCGPGLQISETKRAGKFKFSLHQVIRYDYIYQKMPLESPTPNGFNYEVKRKMIFDLYGDISRMITGEKATLSFSLGAAICGLNSGYTETQRVYQTPTSYTDNKKEKNFVFPAIIAGAGWQKKKFIAELKFGYCWNDPTLYNTPFIFPELSIQYQLFSF